mgnify:CR=1 FL=1
MKKSLIAVAVAAALPTIAFAQTNVTLYGIADASIGVQDKGGGNKSQMVVSSGTQNTSRWGIRGTEDLGGGLNAVFNFESGMKVDTGSPTGPAGGSSSGMSFDRRSVVGLQGGFGTVWLGRDYTPGFASTGATDVMAYGLYGNLLTYTVAGAIRGASTGGSTANGANYHGIETRASNGVHYVSPSMGGLTVRAMYSVGHNNPNTPAATSANPNPGQVNTLGESAANPTRAGHMAGLSAVFAAGPLTAQAYYQQLKGISGTSTTNNNQYGVGAGYNFGAFRVTANYLVADPHGNNNKHTGISVGAGVKIGTGEVLAQFIQQKVATGASTEPKANSLGVAYVHPLSRRTNLYATFGMTRNNSAGTFFVRSGDETVTVAPVGGRGGPGDDPKAFGLGVRHTF